MRCRHLLVVGLLLAVAGQAPAGILFGKKPKKPAPTERVPELVSVIKNDGDENKRLDAVEELRQYDATAFPTIVPTLIDVLMTDKKPAVRAEAALSLGKVRPVSQEAGQALEHAQHNDASMRVRLQARSSLLQYHWSGYHGKPGDAPPLANPAAVPPAVNTSGKPPAVTTLPSPVSPPARLPTPARPTTREPPLAPPLEPAPPVKAPGSNRPPVVPVPTPAAPGDKGPNLGSPN